MIARRALLVGGILNFLFALFHISFPWLFSWSEDLQTITHVNQAILYTFHAVMVLVLVVFAYLSLFHRDELLSTHLGRIVLFMIGAVWLVRSLAEILYFQIGVDGASWRLVLFLLLALVYGYAAIIRVKAASLQ